MSIRSFNLFQEELRVLGDFYEATVDSFKQTEAILDFAGSDANGFQELLQTSDFPWIKSRHFRRKRKFRNKTRKVLRELLLVRMISALETFLIDVIRDIFLKSKVPFMDKAVRHEFSQEELIALNNPTKIFNRIFNRETRKLTNGGFAEVCKYYKSRFDIDLGSHGPGASVMKEYHERRHILVHRLGQTDARYREKHQLNDRTISVSEEYVERLFTDVSAFASELAATAKVYLKSLKSPSNNRRHTRFVVDIDILSDKIPTCLQSDFEFWADDEFVVLSDILIDTEILPNRRIRYFFAGSSRTILKLKKHLRKANQRGLIELNPIADVSTRKRRPLTEGVVEQVKEKLPDQPWPTGIHKTIAHELDLSNGSVSRAIHMLIQRREFCRQIDGRIIPDCQDGDQTNSEAKHSNG